VMRRHNDGAIQMNAGGSMKVVEEPRQKIDTKTRDDVCNDNFTEGVHLTSECTDPANQFMIEDPSMCTIAAKLACPDLSCLPAHSHPNGTVHIEAGIAVGIVTDACPVDCSPCTAACIPTNLRPKRCFIDETNNKWYYNPSAGAELVPSGILAGTPVCRQPEFMEGNAGTNDCHSDQYTHILSDAKCRVAAACLSTGFEQDFVTHVDDRDTRPYGCHRVGVAPWTAGNMGYVMYNPGTNGTDPTPQNVAADGGTPMCQHSDVDYAAPSHSTVTQTTR